MKFLEAHIYQSRQGSSCSRVFGLASTAWLTNCLWIASSKAPSTPFCHCLLTNAPRLPLPDTCLLPTFCSLLSDGLLCILTRLTMSCSISTAAGSPSSHRVIAHLQLWSESILLEPFSPLYLWTWDYFAKALCCFHNSASKLPMNCMNGQHMLVSTFFSDETLTNRGDNTFFYILLLNYSETIWTRIPNLDGCIYSNTSITIYWINICNIDQGQLQHNKNMLNFTSWISFFPQ